MQILLLQTFVWMLLAGLVGAVLGCMAHQFFAGRALQSAAVVASGVSGVKPAVVTSPVAARVAPKGPLVEASKAPAPVAPVTAADRSSGAYNYPITTVGIPRGNPELVQPQIQTIKLPSAAGTATTVAGGATAAVAVAAGATAAAVTIRQPAASEQSTENSYPITTIGIPKGYIETAAAPLKATAGDATRFERALTGEPAQPRPEPLRPELGRSSPVAAPAAQIAKAPAVPVSPTGTATVAPDRVAPGAPAPVKPVELSVAATVAPVVTAPPKPAADAPGAPAPTAKVPNAPIASKPAGIAAGSPPLGPIESRPAGIAPLVPETAVAGKLNVAADVPFEPVVAGGAALAAIAARAASAQAAAAAVANAVTSVPVAAAPVAAAPVAVKTEAAAVIAAAPAGAPSVAPQAATGGDDLMRIRAVDSVMQERLKAAGVTRFSEIARWVPGDVARISQTLGLSGRIEQENWIEQAQILATGGETDYSRRRLRGEIPAAPVGATVAPLAGAVAAKPASGGSDASLAAATAAAAAMASAAITRATANVDAAMPSKLVDAIRENLAKPGAAVAAVVAPVVGVVKAAAAADDATVADAGRVSRPDLAGLRSVRSEALRDPSAGVAGRQGAAVEDLKRVRGIGVLIEKKLNSLGVTGYEQIANWTNADIDRVSQILDFKGRIERENWVEQARILASGGHTEFSKRVDRGEA